MGLHVQPQKYIKLRPCLLPIDLYKGSCGGTFYVPPLASAQHVTNGLFNSPEYCSCVAYSVFIFDNCTCIERSMCYLRHYFNLYRGIFVQVYDCAKFCVAGPKFSRPGGSRPKKQPTSSTCTMQHSALVITMVLHINMGYELITFDHCALHGLTCSLEKKEKRSKLRTRALHLQYGPQVSFPHITVMKFSRC